MTGNVFFKDEEDHIYEKMRKEARKGIWLEIIFGLIPVLAFATLLINAYIDKTDPLPFAMFLCFHLTLMLLNINRYIQDGVNKQIIKLIKEN